MRLMNYDVPALYGPGEITGMHLELTDKCNAGCPMCPRYINNGAELNPKVLETEITLEQFKTWFPPQFVKQLKRVYACGNYGDPIVAKDSLEIFKYMREHNPNMALTLHTNASARTPAWWTELGKIVNNFERGDFCVFSVDGLDDTNHLYRRNTRFDKILANMKAFKAAGGVAKWDFIVFKHNEHQVEQARALAMELGFEFFNVKRTTRWHKWNDKGQGYYEVLNKDKQVLYKLEQPDNEDFRDSNFKELKTIGIVPMYITNQEFDKMQQISLEHREWDNEKNQWVKFKHNDIEVSCRAQHHEKGGNNQLNEIFVSASGHVFPCCFIGGEPWRHISDDRPWEVAKQGAAFKNISDDASIQMIELAGGMDTLSLHKNTLSQILKGQFFDRFLPRSLYKGHNMRSRQCSTCCGKEWNKLDNGELGNQHHKTQTNG